MTVATEADYAERVWTGAETSFAPGFVALDRGHVTVTYQAFDGTLSLLTFNIHYGVTLAAVSGAVTVLPLALPAASADAPGLLLIGRNTPATQGVDFVNLDRYDPAVHTAIADRLSLIAAEVKGAVRRFLLPFMNVGGVLDFRPYRLKAAYPVDAADLATKLYADTVSGTNAQAGAEAARDIAIVAAGTATAQAGIATGAANAAQGYAAVLANPDYGFYTDVISSSRDYGTYV